MIHYSFPRHMSYALIVARHENLKKYCAENDIELVDVTAPTPLVIPALPEPSSLFWRMFRVRLKIRQRYMFLHHKLWYAGTTDPFRI